MQISRPREPVYYYECSGGRFRLVYFMPPELLETLQKEQRISKQALEDFPDGVDLGCTGPDFAEFEKSYAYRPPHDPEALCRAFHAIFSSTRNWQTFRGSGFMPAKDLEDHLSDVEDVLKKADAVPLIDEIPMEAPPVYRRKLFTRRAAERTYMQQVLEEYEVRGIDAKAALPQQSFGRIVMEKGVAAEKVFSALQQGKRLMP